MFLWCLVYLGFAVYFWSHLDSFSAALSELNGIILGLVILTLLGQWVIRAWRDRFIYREVGFEIPVIALTVLNTLQVALNHLPLRAGTVFTATEMKRYYGVSFAKFAAFFVLQSFFILTSATAVGTICVMIYGDLAEWQGQVAFAFMSGIFLSSMLALVLLRRPRCLLSGRLSDYVLKLAEGFGAVRSARWTFVKAYVFSVAVYVLVAIRMILLYRLVGVDLEIGHSILIASVVALSMFISLTPAAIGVREGLLAVFSVAIGYEASSGALVSAIDRGAALLVACSVALIYPVLRRTVMVRQGSN